MGNRHQDDTDARLEQLVGLVTRERRASHLLLALYAKGEHQTEHGQQLAQEAQRARLELVDQVEALLVQDLELVPSAWWRNANA